MKKKNYTGIVPDQHTGKQIDTESSIQFDTTDEAQAFFKVAKSRLLNVNQWHELAGKALAVFHLTDENGVEINRTVKQGDHFKIDIPGPGSKSGEGYDWVHVESVVEETSQPTIESVGIRVRPAPNPQTNKEETAHFYSDQSTSNFIVTREGNTITASVYDRNTSTNPEAENITDRLRHSTVGAGAISIFSKIQWKSLVEGLLKRD
jgi:hypothetical protein